MTAYLQHRQRELHHFWLLSQDQQVEAIRRLAASGVSASTIAAATAFSVEAIRQLLGERVNPGRTP